MALTSAPSPPRWPLWTVPAALLSALALAVAGQLLIIGILSVIGVHVDATNPSPGLAVALNAVLDVALVVCALSLASVGGRRPTLSDLGLRPVPVRRAILPVVAVALGYLLLAGLYSLLVNAPQDRVSGLGHRSPATSIVAYGLLVSVIAPVAEEVFFRGFAFTALRRRIGIGPAAVASGLLFAVVHLLGTTDAVFVPALALFGIGLALLYARTRSLLPGIALHSLNNSIALSQIAGWDWQLAVLVAGAWALLAVVLLPLVRRRPGPEALPAVPGGR